jgi:tetratricopeptide (TPR) repeat protein
MARDNDDLVRAALVLSMAAGSAFLLATIRIKVPMGLAIPCLAFTLAQFASCFGTWNTQESLKEFLKLGLYQMVFLTLASTASNPNPGGKRPGQLKWALTLAGLGVFIGLLHAAPSLPSFRSFPLWSDKQVIASLLSALFFCGAGALLLAGTTVRRSVINGCVFMAGLACALGLMQFYSIDPLRPWDPRAPYMTTIRNLPEGILNLLAALTGGQMQMEAGGTLVLSVPRILGIYGNPDFFAPYILQFIPFAVAVAWLDPAKRVKATILGMALAVTLGLTAVWGAFVSLVLLAPFFAVLLYFASDKISRAQAWKASITLLLAGAAVSFILVLGLWKTAAKRPAIEERVVKWRLAEAMWELKPFNGVGLNAYKTWYPLIQQDVRLHHELPFELLGSSFTQENRTHNDMAQMIGETGVLGFGTFMWFMAALVAFGLHAIGRRDMPVPERASLVGLLGGVLVTLIYALPNFPFHIVSSAGTFWIMAGLLASYRPGEYKPADNARKAPALNTLAPAPAGPALPPAERPKMRAALVYAAYATILLTTVFCFKVFWGTLYYKRGDFYSRIAKPPEPRKAVVEYDTSLGLDGSCAQYAYDVGAMCFNNLNTDAELGAQAGKRLRLAFNWGFINEDLAYGLGHLAERAQDRAGALKWYTFAVSLNERHEPSRQGRLRMLLIPLEKAEAAAMKKNWKQAERLYAEAYQADPGNFLAAYKLGSLYMTVFKDFKKGTEYLEEAASRRTPLEVVPGVVIRAGGVNEPSMWVSLGRAYASASNWPGSLRAFTRAHTLSPKDPEIISALDQLEKLVHQAPPPALPAPGQQPPAPNQSRK